MKNVSISSLIILCCIVASTLSLAEGTNDTACIAESVALVTTTAVSEPYQELKTAIETDVKDDIMQFCNVLKRSCTVNVGDYSAALETACIQEGGQIVSKQATLDCQGKLMQIPIPGGIDIYINDIPGCVGASCDGQNLPSEIEAAFDTAVEQVATEVETAVAESDITCGAITTASDGGSGGASTRGGLPILAGVSILAALFSWTLF